MKIKYRIKQFLMAAAFLLLPYIASANIKILAAENVYGDIAKSIGADAVSVTSILSNPNQDPHLFAITPDAAKKFQQAQLIIINGADYDPWAENLAKSSDAKILNVAQVNVVSVGANPHLWYNFAYVEAFAKALTMELSQLDPNHKAEFAKNEAAFLVKVHQLQHEVMLNRAKLTGTPVTATEPVAEYLTQALSLKMLNQRFQLSIMNDADPSVKDRAEMIESLRQHQVKLLIVNQQVNDPLTQQLEQLAKDKNIPVVGVVELMPQDQHYFPWMQTNIQRITKALM